MNLREAIATQPMRAFQKRIIGICIALAFVDGFEVLVAAFTSTAVAKAFALPNAADIGYFLSAGTFGMGLGAIVISPLADKLGRRKHILMCLALICVGMAASALAPTSSFPFLLGARFFAGLWIGALIPSLNILVSEYSSDAKRGTAMGIYGIGLPAGAATGGFITTFLLNAWGWSAPFWFGFILTAILLVAAYLWLPESIPALPAAHAATGKPQNVVQMIFGGKMLGRTMLLWFGYACLMAAFYFANTWTPRLVVTYLTNPANGGMALKDAQAIGNNAGVLVAVGGVVGALLFAFLARRVHPRLLTAYTLLWGLAAYVIYANVFRSTSAALLAAVGVGIAANGGVAAFYAISPSVYPTAARGTGVGWMVGFGRVVSILAPIVSGYLIDGGMGSQTLYQIYGVILAIGALLVFMLHKAMSSDSTSMNEQVSAASH